MSSSVATWFFVDPKRLTNTSDQEQAAYDRNQLMVLAIILFLVGVLVAGLSSGKYWSAALVVAFSTFILLALFGFLFGIPKSVAQSAAGATPPQTVPGLAVNTNLEQISDWLTKIIVGIGLIQLKQFPTYLHQAALYLAPMLGGVNPSTTALSSQVEIYFGSLGFLTGYLTTRVFLSHVIQTADSSLSHLPTEAKDTVSGHLSSATANLDKSQPPSVPSSVGHAAHAIVTSKALSELTNVDDMLAWGQSQLALGHFTQASEAFEKVLQSDPDCLTAHLGLGLSYYSSNESIDKAISHLLAANALVTSETDSDTKAAIYENLAAAYLYTDPPAGYQFALQYADKALALNSDNAKIYFYMAAARGQNYAWRKTHGAQQDELMRIREGVLQAAQAAVQLDPGMADRLWELATNPTSIDNDLVPFASDPDFLRIVGKTGASQLTAPASSP